jgi:hypothetical protein
MYYCKELFIGWFYLAFLSNLNNQQNLMRLLIPPAGGVDKSNFVLLSRGQAKHTYEVYNVAKEMAEAPDVPK